ncbi:GTPase-activating protein IML1 [Aspergillus clavatus NRRL 1]|uniref:Vacuolar membrane-associated protein iml1 n=1 Tax=Aspergillus clavatus (strain ATCC 1007 / CBS 513.65 / DSM 816 / NCTC 3887 / NRRL 1 / QM 1276 / 107) TaxID=344612 RepID=IML1_ASPCL|nr:Dishevelled, Egl-10, and Pleckstrin domain protein [Aspergillus clavatus NRRL 1]A1CEE0.1 RecName: Full=Vacuolar membrane-associated protein iml1 [Aspergillus clavatus NRRL 1]EAW11239.1 Dishevelled, Egl-10, and Pleckstrin domain protein [Aspergillus clavatus NRRL 1]
MSLRGPMKRSHLRQVSAPSVDDLATSSQAQAQSHPRDGGPYNDEHGQDFQSTLDARNIRLSTTSLERRQVSLWVHDETFSREEILFNQAAFSDLGVGPGDVIEILPVRSPGDSLHSIKSDLGLRALRDSYVETGPALLPDPMSKFKTPLQSRCLFVVKPLPQEIKARHPKLEISVTSSVANIFGFKNRTLVHIDVVDRAQCSASHVDIAFRDQFLVRSDMWRLVMSELAEKIIYKGQKIVFMGSIKATVKNIFIREKKVLSGYFSPHTIPVFRSESAKYVLFIQMSREMWDFDSEGTGDILFSRVINGFLPELFKRWANSEAKHLVTIVLFTRVEYDVSAIGAPLPLSSETLRCISSPNHVPTRDFYRVVVNDMASGHWTAILDELKKDFRTFLRDVSTLKMDCADTPTLDGVKVAPKNKAATIAGRPSTALRGNILEAIHLASAHLAYDHIDRDMVHTGTSIIVITPGSGVFEVSYESLSSTSEALANRGIAIDLVCLSPMPLHSVPLFKYKAPAQRSSSSSFCEFNSSGYSPEMRHSFSFASRTPHLSPKSAAHGSFSRGTAHKEHAASRSDEWNYGIPHWLDISYWNPDTYREARRILKKDLNAPIPFTVTKQSKTFVPRVRMYEIQMMGVMESEQSNISIPYLLEGEGIHRAPSLSLGLSPSALSSTRASYRRNPYKLPLSDSLRPEPFLQGLSNPKDVMLARSKKAPKAVLAWMEQYDDAVFQPFAKRRHQRKPSKPKRLSEPDVQVSGAHERLSARSVLRLREHETNANSSERPYPTRTIPRVAETSLSAPQTPVPSKSASPKKPALKPPSAGKAPRISRTISFALRGLSATPPRALASTEVNVEHASALPTSSPKLLPGPFPDTRSVDSFSGSDSASISTVIDTSLRPASPHKTPQSRAIMPSRPISIKVPPRQPSEDAEPGDRAVIPESYSTTSTAIPFNEHHRRDSHTRTSGPRFEMTVNGGSRDSSIKSPQNKALAPWVRSINPCNTSREVLRDTSWFGRWQHAYPRPPHVAVVKWKSLKSPAILPLTTEEFPTAKELGTDYLQTPYRVFPNDDPEGFEVPKTRGILLREMISLRLSHGFQIVIGKHVAEVSGQHALETLNVFNTASLERNGATIFLSKGNSIHRLVCVDGGEIEVTRFTHRTSSALAAGRRDGFSLYSPAMRTILSPEYELKNIKLDPTAEEYNWNYADNYVAGHRDYLFNPAQQLQFWRVRYVLIPMHLHVNTRRHLQSFNEDNEEEIHLLGINQLTHIWQRHKYIPPEEKRFESSNKKKEQNPLNIMYQTRNPSEVVAAELDRILLSDPGLDSSPAQLLPESELLKRSSISLSSLAHIIQGDKGVRMMDRRWHWRLHYNCFIGFELTTWLLQNFRDIDSREEAVDFGNELMKHGLFQHVEKRHNFRDGNYFYQISSEHRISRPESRGGWFPQKRSDKGVPSTPASNNAKDSPLSGHARSDSLEDGPPHTPATPSKSKNKATIMLSKMMKYDVDPRKRSNRPEVIDLHYDRLHNPDNCFHFELSWMNTTPKLIEDTVLSWAATAEKFGLKLVQVPIAEASAISRTQPFRKPYRVSLKIPPPKGPVPTLFNTASFSQPGFTDMHYYHKAMLRKFDFVLDFEARSAFPADVGVSYSWGTPDYQYPQYIHRSGSTLVQLTDEGDFLFLANRLVSTRAAASREMPRYERMDRAEHLRTRAATHDPLDRLSPRLSPIVRPLHEIGSPQVQSSIDSAHLYRAPELIILGFAEFCNDEGRLEQFYKESHARPVSTKVGPATTTLMDSSIPSLELPASVVSHHLSHPPALVARASVDGSISSIDVRVRARNDSVSYKGSPRSGSLRPLNLS